MATMVGWESERFARTKTIKALGDYLKPAPSPEQKREQGARDVLTLFRRAQAKQKKKGTMDGVR